MIKFKLYLDKPQNESSFIMLNIVCNGFRLQVSTNLKVLVKHWNKDKQTFKKLRSNTIEENLKIDNSDLIDDFVNRIRAYYFEQSKNNHFVTKEELKKAINLIKNPYSIDRMQFFEVFEEYINNRIGNVKDRTIKSFRTLGKHLSDFQEKTKQIISFHFFDIEENCNKLRAYLNNNKNLSNNTVGAIFKTLKTFLNYCFDKKIINSNIYLRNLKRANEKETQSIALTIEELKAIENLELLSNRLQQVRDVFVIQCYTGLRFSDIINLKPENIDLSENRIKIYQIKTTDWLIIPILANIKQLFEKYKCSLPKISNQKFNLYIKEIAALAGISQMIQITKFVGKNRIDGTMPKHELISSHTARRTMITIALKSKMLPEEVMRISGHKDRSTFQKYVKISQEKAINEFENKFGK